MMWLPAPLAKNGASVSRSPAAARSDPDVHDAPTPAVTPEPPAFTEVALRVNGVEHTLTIDTRTSLIDGRRANSCLALVVAYAHSDVVTVEGLAAGGEPHALQRAFVEHDAFQCGYCTPGQLCSAAGMLDELRAGRPSAVTDGEVALSAEEVRERMSGNICRCGAYPNLVRAILEAGA